MDVTRQIQLLNLEAGNLSISIAPEIGGSVASFTKEIGSDVFDIFRPLKTNDYDPRRVMEMGCFPLVPYSNRIRDGKFHAPDRFIEIPNNCHPDPHHCHGTGWLKPWTVLDVSPNSTTLELEPDYNLPVHYGAKQVFELTPQALTITLFVNNLCSITFPVGLGLHPYFSHKSEAVITANIPNEWGLDRESLPVNFHKNPDANEYFSGLPAEELKEMSAYADWRGKAKISWPARNTSVTIEAQPNLSHLLMWAPPHEDFFCVEPVSHAIDGFNLAHEGAKNVGGIMLAAGETYAQKFIFSVEAC